MRLLSVFYQRDFLPSKDADHWLNWLQQENNVAWARESFSIFGRRVTAPRRLAWFGDAGLNYRYTGTDHMAEGWPTALSALRDRVQAVAAQEFNFLLLNRYANGQQYMGWHRDDEAGCAGNIASLSLGAPRRFRPRSPPCRWSGAWSSPSKTSRRSERCLTWWIRTEAAPSTRGR